MTYLIIKKSSEDIVTLFEKKRGFQIAFTCSSQN